MKTRFWSMWLLVPLALTAGLVALLWANDSAWSKPLTAEPAAVSVTKFEQALPVGYLGVSLGTVVRVTGVAIDGDTLGWKGAAGKTFLRIETVNGKRLEQPIDFEFLRAPREVREPAAGERMADPSFVDFGRGLSGLFGIKSSSWSSFSW